MKKTVLTSFTILCLLSSVFLMGLAFYIEPVKASGTIYIRPDGSVDPPTANITSVDNVTYTLTGNIIGNSIVVQKSNIVLDGAGFTLQGTGDGDGIELKGRRYVTIQNLEIKSFSNGISHYQQLGDPDRGAIYIDIINNSIHSINENGILLRGWGGVVRNITISGNDISSEEDGIYLESFAIEWGGALSSIHDVIISDNTIYSHGTAIFLFALASSAETPWESATIRNVTISGNNISSDEDGIYFYTDAWGWNGVFNNTIYHNTIYGSVKIASAFMLDESTNSFDNGYPSGGNYWSDYSGFDLFTGTYQNETGSDGIGDTPYPILAGNQDNYPLMYPFGSEMEEVWTAYRNLLLKYAKIHSDFEALSSTLCELLGNITDLHGKYDTLLTTINNTQEQISSLNSTINDMQKQINSLNNTFQMSINDLQEQLSLLNSTLQTSINDQIDLLNSTLQSSVSELQELYNSLNSTLTSDQVAIISELSTIRNLMYVLIVTTIILIATTVYFAIIKPKIKP